MFNIEVLRDNLTLWTSDIPEDAAIILLALSEVYLCPLFWGIEIGDALSDLPSVEAEEQPEISELYSVSAVPYFLFFKEKFTAMLDPEIFRL